jgi:SAM-dependent methyltransferase
MKRCLSCNALYPSPATTCLACGYGPALVDGFHSYAPELADASSGFKSTYFSELALLEGDNFWFQSRNQLIIWAIKEYCKNFRSFLEIGCGTGYALSGIANGFVNTELYGSEIFTTGLGFAAGRLPSVNFMQMDARNIPFSEEFDVIGAFDVLEHIDDDELVLSQVYAALRPQGYLILTVPQHAWLWSAIDEYACHVRRYSAVDLHQKIEAAGFEVMRSTSFVTTLLPAMMASRFMQRRCSSDTFDAAAELKIHPLLNFIFKIALKFELLAIRCGINLPIGGSRLIVARKI